MDGLSTSEFDRFATARWPELVRTAYLVSGDAEAAVRASVATLAHLSRQWSRVTEEGSPAATARGDLLARLLDDDTAGPRVLSRLPRRLRDRVGRSRPGARQDRARPEPANPWAAAPSAARSGAGAPDPGPAADPWAVTTDALWDAFGRAPALARAVYALRAVEGLDTGQAGQAAGRLPAAVTLAMSAAGDELAAAHAAARRGLGLDPVPQAVPDDLQRTLQQRLAGLRAPQDPLPILRVQRSSRRRRNLLAAAGVAAVLAVVAGLTGASALSAPTRPSAPAASASADWTSIETWPARGELAGDAGTRLVVNRTWGFGARILYAGDVGSTRFVVAWVPGNDGLSTGTDYGVDPTVGVMTGPAHSALDRTSPTTNTGNTMGSSALSVEATTGAGTTDLLVLAHPEVAHARISPTITFTADGPADRVWQTMDLVGGVGTMSLAGDHLLALRVKVDTADGAPIGSFWDGDHSWYDLCSACSRAAWAEAVAVGMRAQLAGATGLPVDEISRAFLFNGQIGGRASGQRPMTRAAARQLADAVVIRYDLPGGVHLKVSASRAVDGGGWNSVDDLFVPIRRGDGRPLVVIPSGLTGDLPPDVGIVAPGAARMRVVSILPEVPPGPVVSTPSGSAVLGLPDPNAVPESYQLKTWDAGGHLLGTWDMFAQNDFDPLNMWS